MQGRNLVAERLAAAGRHEDKGILAADDGGDDLLLVRPERGIAENVFQGFMQGGGQDGASRGGLGYGLNHIITMPPETTNFTASSTVMPLSNTSSSLKKRAKPEVGLGMVGT